MRTLLDLAQTTVDSKLILPPETLDGLHSQHNMERSTQATCSPWKLDEGWMSDPSDGPRSRRRPRKTRYPRQATAAFIPGSAAVRTPRTSRTWGPGNRRSMRPYPPLSPRESPVTQLGPLSRSTSPRRTFGASYYYEGFLQGSLQEALQSDAIAPFNRAAPPPPPPRCQETIPLPSMQHLWLDEECRPFSSLQLLNDTLSSQTPQASVHQTGTDESAQEATDDSFLDNLDRHVAEIPRLGPDHRFWKVKDSLVHEAQIVFAQCHRFIPAADLHKRRSRAVFACPFFRRDPSRHWPCLADTSMSTIAGVKRHLWRNHSQPYYCPVCYEIFPLASERDVHILRRECETEPVVRFGGMTSEQKRSIVTRIGGCSEEEQWYGIWKILFGRARGTLEPFLPAAMSSDLLLVVGFWKSQGREVTEKFLEDAGIMGVRKTGNITAPCKEDDEEGVGGLVNAVLQDLVKLIFWRSRLASAT